jgi:hypothetical protein
MFTIVFAYAVALSLVYASIAVWSFVSPCNLRGDS